MVIEKSWLAYDWSAFFVIFGEITGNYRKSRTR